jgi:hypothetical protein
VKRGVNKHLSRLAPLALAVLLSACSASGSSSSRTPSSYTVEYYDDAATPLRVGFSYVAPMSKTSSGLRYGDGSLIGHYDPDYDGGTAYDFVSRSGKAVTSVGNHWVFDRWADGEGNPFDLTKVSGDCKVYASFKEEAYAFGVRYYNDDAIPDDPLSQIGKKALVFGSQPTYPSAYVSYQQVDYSGTTSIASGFWGFDWLNPSDPTSVHPDFYLKGDGTKAKIPSSWVYASGVGAPQNASAAGTLYADTSLNDSHSTNPTYPLYLSNGASWIGLGKLADGVEIDLYASYLKVAHAFAVGFYDQDPGKGGVLKGSLSVPFGETLAWTADGSTMTATYASQSVSFAATAKNWKGHFVNCEAVNPYYGKTVENGRIVSDAVYYPVV